MCETFKFILFILGTLLFLKIGDRIKGNDT